MWLLSAEVLWKASVPYRMWVAQIELEGVPRKGCRASLAQD